MIVLLSLASICFLSFIYLDNVRVGGFCNEDKQCTGSNNSETCKDGRCQCSDRYILLDLECIQGICPQIIYHMIDILYNYLYVLKITLSIYWFISLFFEQKKMCRIVWYNDYCNINIKSGISLTISIQWNYIICVGNLSLSQSCIVHEQCSLSNYSRCVNETCKCMKGYTAENFTSCIKCMVFISLFTSMKLHYACNNKCIIMCNPPK